MADIHYAGGMAPERAFEPSDYEEYAGAPSRDSTRVGQLINLTGALMSMALLVGMAVWTWQLMVRDVTGVPVIRALEGPMRVAPEDPGGAVAENQGLSVNRLAEGEEAAPVPDQLVLAPPPVELTPVARPTVPEIEEFESASLPLSEAVAEVEDAPTEPVSTSALIERLLVEANSETPLEPLADPVIQADTVPISVPGVRRSPRPLARPEGLQPAATPTAGTATLPTDIETTSAPAAAIDGIELDATQLEAGVRLVQMGAFDTADLARAEWNRLTRTYPDFFLGRARVIEEATSGGQTFYRLRAHGFEDLAASRRFCAALVPQGAACIPVTVR